MNLHRYFYLSSVRYFRIKVMAPKIPKKKHPGASREKKRPNILFVISDDQSYPHASAYGYKAVNTPAFDRIAAEGVLFTNAYAASPGCSPSRAALHRIDFLLLSRTKRSHSGQHTPQLTPGEWRWLSHSDDQHQGFLANENLSIEMSDIPVLAIRTAQSVARFIVQWVFHSASKRLGEATKIH